MNYIGLNIKMLRESMGFSQDQVANQLGISRVQLSYYENYSREEIPSVPLLTKLSDLFCVDLKTLLEKDLDVAKINASFAFRSADMADQDIRVITNFHELIKNYIKMQKLINVN